MFFLAWDEELRRPLYMFERPNTHTKGRTHTRRSCAKKPPVPRVSEARVTILRFWFLLSRFSRLCGHNSQKRNDGYQHSHCSRCRFLDWKCFSSSFLFFFCFKIYGVTLFCPDITITISSAVSLPWQNTNNTKIKTMISRPGEFYLFQLISLF